jgi:hypothetical protein
MTGSGPIDPEPPPEDQTEPATGPEPVTPAWDLLSGTANPRAEALAAWVADQRGAHTMAALERSALESGYTKADFDEGVRLAGQVHVERQVITPLRRRATLIVLVGYGLVWLFFGVQFLVIPAPGAYVSGSGLQSILTISLVIALFIGLAWVHAARPDPDRTGRALAILLAAPLVLLVGVAGLCLPFVPMR